MTKIPLFIVLMTQVFVSNAMESMDGYYSDDLLGAVDEAKEKPHHYDYSNTYRYKRTTAQSIELNRINLNELEETHLSITAQGSDDSELTVISNNNKLVQETKEQSIHKFNLETFSADSNFIQHNIGISRSANGDISSQGISNQSSLVSTPRP